MKPGKRVRGAGGLAGQVLSLTSAISGGLWFTRPSAALKPAKGLLPALLIFLLLALTGLTLRAQTYPFREYTSDDGLPQTQSLHMMQDSRGYLWIPTRNGLARFNGYTFESYLRKDGLPSNIVSKVHEAKNGIIWALTINGVARFDGKNFTSFPTPDSMGIKQLSVRFAFLDTATILLNAYIDFDKRILLLFENGRYRDFSEAYPSLKNRNLEVLGVNPNDSTIYLFDEKNTGYSFHGGVLTKTNSGPVTDFEFINGEPHFLDLTNQPPGIRKPFFWEEGGIALYFTDREGTIWAGTETSIFRLMSEAFVEYDRTEGFPDETWAIAADPRGGIWMGTYNGNLTYFNGETFTSNNEYNKRSNKPGAFYRGCTTLSNGEVWFSTSERVIVWDGKQFKINNSIPEKTQVCIIYEDPVDKSILVGTDKGLYHLKDGEVIHYPQMSWPGYGIVEGIARDHDGNYWLAGHYGIVYFDGKNFIPFRAAPAPAEMVWGVVCDYAGNIWSAGSDGIFICIPNEPGFTQALPEEVNLPANVIRDMGNHRLIVGRMMDICIIDLDKYYSGQLDYYTIIDRSRGFLGKDCQDNGIVKDSNGHWWILTRDKLIRFYPEKLQKNLIEPVNHITMVEIPGDTTEWKTALEASLFYDTTSTVNIRGRENRIRITYTGISTKNPEKVRYQYRMKGYNDSWSNRTAERSVVYTDLPSGHYIFEVQAINADGIFSDEPDRLSISVVPTFFQSTFSIAVLSLLALVLVVLLSLQIRKSFIERRIATARMQAETYRLQLNSVIKQFDPHFTFNAVTSVGSLIMKGEKVKAYNYFIKLSNLLRSIITDSNALLKPLEEELEFVTRYCELQKLRFGDRFEYRIDIGPDVNLKSPVPKMIVQSFAENAIKHGLENRKENGMLEIIIRNLTEGVRVTIRDNGIGRAAASELQTQGAGTGLNNIRGIVDTLNKFNKEKIAFVLKDLYDHGKASGTEVNVFLPYNYSLNLPPEHS